MEKKINIAELLKDCPTGMELGCTMFDDVYFDHISDCGKFIYCYINYEDKKTSISFNKYGAYCNLDKSKCVIFPKNKNSWERFRRPFKDGDIVATNEQIFILQRVNRGTLNNCYKGDCYTGYDFKYKEFFAAGEWAFERHATEEEKQKLFKAIKDNGYKWNTETKTLEKLPKFKVGNKVRPKGSDRHYIIENIEFDRYILNNSRFLKFTDEHDFELVPNKFDITTLKPFDKVLVRSDYGYKWIAALYSNYSLGNPLFVTAGGFLYKQCIPYEGNEHLLGTTNDCDYFYKTWEQC